MDKRDCHPLFLFLPLIYERAEANSSCLPRRFSFYFVCLFVLSSAHVRLMHRLHHRIPLPLKRAVQAEDPRANKLGQKERRKRKRGGGEQRHVRDRSSFPVFLSSPLHCPSYSLRVFFLSFVRSFCLQIFHLDSNVVTKNLKKRKKRKVKATQKGGKGRAEVSLLFSRLSLLSPSFSTVFSAPFGLPSSCFVFVQGLKKLPNKATQLKKPTHVLISLLLLLFSALFLSHPSCLFLV